MVLKIILIVPSFASTKSTVPVLVMKLTEPGRTSGDIQSGLVVACHCCHLSDSPNKLGTENNKKKSTRTGVILWS